MKRSITIFTLALVSCMATAQNSNGILQKSEGSITFVVDEDLAPIEDEYPMENFLKGSAFALDGIFRDEGIPYDPLQTEEPVTGDPQLMTIGGYGIFMVRTIADSVTYEYDHEKGQNVLVIKKKIQ